MANIKVNFMISKIAKKNIETVKLSENITNSAIVDKLLQFDDEALDFFVSIYKKQNEERIKKQDYLNMENGSALIFNQETVQKILDSDIANISSEKVRNLGIVSILNESKEESETNLSQQIGELQKAVIYMNKELNSLKEKGARK